MKKIVITKNEYKVIEIVESNSNNDTCEFKIVPQMDSDKFRAFYLKMFSLKKEIKFDTNNYVEITYHKAQGNLNTKIQIKVLDKETKKVILDYIPLPLENLVDPNYNTEIPIPLLKITVPDKVLSVPYVHKSKYERFEMGDNNIFEIFMTKNGFDFQHFVNCYPLFFNNLIDDSFEFFTSTVYRDYNSICVFNEIGYTGTKDFAIGKSDVTNDIGIFAIGVFDPRIKFEKMTMLFVENKFYLAVLTNRLSGMKQQQLAYEYDAEHLDGKEKEDFLSIVENNINEFADYAQEHKEEYFNIQNYYSNNKDIEIDYK